MTPAERSALLAERDLLAAALDEAELLVELDELERELDITERRLPADARRGLFPHERTAATLFADIDLATRTLAERLLGIGEEYRRRYAGVFVDELRDRAGTEGTEDRRVSRIVEAVRDIDDPARIGVNAAVADRAGGPDTFAEYRRELLAHRDAAGARLLAEARAQGLRVGALPAATAAELDDIEAAARRLVTRSTANLDTAVADLLRASPVYELGVDGTLRNVTGTLDGTLPLGERARASEARSTASTVEGATRTAVAPVIAVPSAIYASELLDRNTCTPCSHVDGREYARLADALVDYPSGQYVGCDGGDRCRGTLVYVWPTEAPPTQQAPGTKRPPRPPAPPGAPVPPRPGGPPVAPAAPAVTTPAPGPAVLAPVRLPANVDLDANAPELAAIPDGVTFTLAGPVRIHRGVVTPSRGGIAVKDRGVVFHVESGTLDGDGRTEAELLDHLRAMTETSAPGELREALGSVTAVAYRDGRTIASSTGRSVVFYDQRWLGAGKAYKRATFDHESGHSVAHALNARISARYRAIGTPGGPPTGSRADLGELLGFGSTPPDVFTKGRTRDLYARKRAAADAAKVLARYADDFARAPFGTAFPPLDEWLKARPGELAKVRLSPDLLIEVGNDAVDISNDKPIRFTGRGVWGSKSGSGVTDYGASSTVEDWAESWRLYLRDRRVGYLARSRIDGSPVTFADLFPNRHGAIERWLRAAGVDVAALPITGGPARSIVAVIRRVATADDLKVGALVYKGKGATLWRVVQVQPDGGVGLVKATSTGNRAGNAAYYPSELEVDAS